MAILFTSAALLHFHQPTHLIERILAPAEKVFPAPGFFTLELRFVLEPQRIEHGGNVETLKNLENKYFSAKPLAKRLILEIFLSKLLLEDGKLLFKPSSLVITAQNADVLPVGRATEN